MKREPKVRQKVFDLYWYFVSERQKVFEARIQGKAEPWTDDPILQKYKFCNVFRAADRVSQYLIKNIAYNKDCKEDGPYTQDDQLFQIVAFRVFSNIETWETLKFILGRYPIIDDLKTGALAESLEKTKKQNGKLYTGAFILCANNAFGHKEKHLNHVELFKKMFVEDSVASKLRSTKSLKEIYEMLHQYPLLGDFMSYQICIDLNYSSQINFSENDFCQVGPGAVRGIKKVFTDLGDYTPNEIVLWMVERQKEEFKRLGLKFEGLFGREMHAIDCQNVFCELDKYCRVALPKLSSARKRIKTTFKKNPKPVEFFFPPKWEIS